MGVPPPPHLLCLLRQSFSPLPCSFLEPSSSLSPPTPHLNPCDWGWGRLRAGPSPRNLPESSLPRTRKPQVWRSRSRRAKVPSRRLEDRTGLAEQPTNTGLRSCALYPPRAPPALLSPASRSPPFPSPAPRGLSCSPPLLRLGVSPAAPASSRHPSGSPGGAPVSSHLLLGPLQRPAAPPRPPGPALADGPPGIPLLIPALHCPALPSRPLPLAQRAAPARPLPCPQEQGDPFPSGPSRPSPRHSFQKILPRNPDILKPQETSTSHLNRPPAAWNHTEKEGGLQHQQTCQA